MLLSITITTFDFIQFLQMSAKRCKQYRDSQKKFKLLLEEAELENASVNVPWLDEIGETNHCDVQSSEFIAYEVLPNLSTREKGK